MDILGSILRYRPISCLEIGFVIVIKIGCVERV